MAKLYPPSIEGRLPAFTGTTMVVPFSMNRAVGSKEVKNIRMLMRPINSNLALYTSNDISHSSLYNINNCSAKFDISSIIGNLTIGLYYRVQIAYVDYNNEVGYFSSVGVIKYTTSPTLSINNLTVDLSNKHVYEYTGIYILKDITEKLYSSYMRMWDGDGNIVYESPEIIHATINDVVSNEAHELFNIPFDLELGHSYKLRFYATSVNGVSAMSPVYRIIASNNNGVEFDDVRNILVTATSNFLRGTIDLTLRHTDPVVRTLKGMYLISRAEDKQPYEWHYIRSVFFSNTRITDIIISDYTIELGKTYIYAIQQYNYFGLYSNRSYSNIATVDFEDYYLVDLTRLLKIRFNPRISSMKNTVVENRTNTIGSKYPYLVRSGIVDYKEFSIAGLISYHEDEDEDFILWSELGLDTMREKRIRTRAEYEPSDKLPTYNLTGNNIAAERIFKLEVLDWLNNGKPKILKSPTEGNYLVVLMGVTMTPNDTVGRMLHSFNATAIEIGKCDYYTLHEYNFFELNDKEALLMVPQWKTASFTVLDEETGILSPYSSIIDEDSWYERRTGEFYVNILPPGDTANIIDIKEVLPGTNVIIGTELITIGATGAYYAELTNEVSAIYIPVDYIGAGAITYQTIGPLYTDFDNIHDYQDKYVCGQLFIGYDINRYDILSSLKSIREKITDLLELRLFKRTVVDIYMDYRDYLNKGYVGNGDKFYYDAAGTLPVTKSLLGVLNGIYDMNNQSILFRINWLNYFETNEINNSTLEHYRQLYDMREISTPIEHEDGSITTSNKLYYIVRELRNKFGQIQLAVYDNFDNLVEVGLLFPVQSNFYYDPNCGEVREINYDIYSAVIGYYNDNHDMVYETVNVYEKERLVYDCSEFTPAYIHINDGIIADLTYVAQTVIYSYEENETKARNYSAIYKANLDAYWNFVLNFDSSRYYNIEDSNGNIVSKNYDECTTELEKFNWRNERHKETNLLLLNVKNLHDLLVYLVQYDYDHDLTRVGGSVDGNE